MYRRLFPYILGSVLLLTLPFAVSAALHDHALHAVQPLALYLDRQRLGIKDFFQNIGELGSLRQQRSDLQVQVATLQQQLAAVEDVRQENQALRQELGITGTTQAIPKIFAHIIVPTSTNPLERSFTIDVGSAQGVREGQPAISQGYLVGQVVSTRANTAVVRSVVSLKSIIQVWIPSINQKGILTGDGNTATISELEQGFTLDTSALVQTSGLGGALPQGILLGSTGSKISGSSETKQSFRVTLGVNPTDLESVFILQTITQ